MKDVALPCEAKMRSTGNVAAFNNSLETSHQQQQHFNRPLLLHCPRMCHPYPLLSQLLHLPHVLLLHQHYLIPLSTSLIQGSTWDQTRGLLGQRVRYIRSLAQVKRHFGASRNFLENENAHEVGMLNEVEGASVTLAELVTVAHTAYDTMVG
ncbi:hypothetical protein LguiB_014787 [Lonicera macranthoides]